MQEEPKVEAKKKRSESDQEEEEEEEEEDEYDDNGDIIAKKAPEPVFVKKDYSDRIASEFDQMIEIQDWKETIIQNSATVLAISVFNESLVYVTIIDIKMRRQTHYHKFKVNSKPTRLFQIDSSNLLVGTECGKLEHLDLTEMVTKKVYDAHPESDAGIGAIQEIKSKSPLLRGPNDDPSFRLIATASLGAPQFRLWRLNSKTRELNPYLKIETTFTEGIKFLLETQDN